MDETKKTTAEAVTETNETEEQGFYAYLEIYGKSCMLKKVYAEFEGDADKLKDKDLQNIVELLETTSGIRKSAIHHSVLKITQG